MNKLIIPAMLLCFTAFVFASCQGNMGEDTETAEATLVWSGEYMVDGCGFELLINDTRYKPENENDINESFKVEGSMPVMVEFVCLGKDIDIRCGLSTESRAMPGIRIISLKKKA